MGITLGGGMTKGQHAGIVHALSQIPSPLTGKIATVIAAGLEASRPAGSATENIYFATDTKKLWAFDGGAWQDCKIIAKGPKNLTAEGFRANAATGTMSEPARLNDNVLGVMAASGDAVGEYCEVAFGIVARFNRFRQYGQFGNDGSGRWTIQYYDYETAAWVNWKTDIPTHTLEAWTDWITGSTIITDKVRLVVEVLDAGTKSYIVEASMDYA